MTWNEVQKYIETLDDKQKECYIVLFDAVRNVYYMATDIVEAEDISKDPCLFISQL